MHNEYTWLMSLVLDEEATAEETARLREHVRACDACAATWRRWQELDRRLATAPVLAAPLNLATRVTERLGEAEIVRRRRQVFGIWFGFTWVIALAVTVGIVVLALNWRAEWLSGGAITAAVSGLLSVGGWLMRGGQALVLSLGAPALAALAGGLLCLTCGLGMVWLWIVGRGAASVPVAARG